MIRAIRNIDIRVSEQRFCTYEMYCNVLIISDKGLQVDIHIP